jgi:Xaa-Pro aminopeptidase
VMKETGFDMWLVICNEDNHDPIFNTMIPFDTWAPITQMLVFTRKPDGSVERLNVSITGLHGLYEDKWKLNDTEDQWTRLANLIKERAPKKIGINEAETEWAADGLTSTLKQKLVKALGPQYAKRLVSAEKLGIRWLETMVEEELEVYERTAAIAHAIIAECYSPDVITPGVTTTDDVRWHYWQRVNSLGLNISFTPFFGFQRSDEMKKRFDPADRIIRHGDLLHCDVGLIYLRLISDHQEMAYVLRPGETDAPKGMKAGLKMANRLQDILMGEFKQGRSGNEILNKALAKAHREKLSNPKIYTHSIGHFLHEPGPLIGLPWEQKDTGARGEVTLNYNTCFSIELGVRCPLKEWGDQIVAFPLEQDAMYTKQGAQFIDGRQTDFHLIG